MKRVMTALLAIVGIYLVYAAFLTLIHPRLIYPFFPEPTRLPDFRPVELTAADGEEVTLQIAEGDGQTVVFFMGNAGALTYFAESLALHRSAGRRVVALEYRGGAGRPGRPSEKALKSDALLAVDHALQFGDPVVLHGYSLGTGLAVHAAARREVDAVILEAPFSSMCRLMTRASFLPACVMPFVQRWNSVQDAPRLDAPVLILHGARDRLIPSGESVALDAALPNSKRLVIEGADHFDVGLTFSSRRAIEDFIGSLLRERK